MAVRPTMQYIINYVRELIGDPSSGGSFTDQQIQDRLDLGRLDIYSREIRAADEVSPDGTILWKHFEAPLPFWEEGATLQEIDGTPVAGATANYLLGHWDFASTRDSDILLVTGKVYNVYSVASSLLTLMVNDLRSNFNFTADGLTVQRISRISDLRAQATSMASQAWGWGWGSDRPTQIKLVRRDVRS